MKKRLFVLFLMAVLCSFCVVALASNNNESDIGITHYDIVLVIDDSGSMKQTDPDKISVSAIKSLVDSLPESGDQVGIVTYGLDVEETMSLREIRSESDKQELKDFADHKILRSSDWTDTASGLVKASEYLDEFKNPQHKQVIILLTDGENDFGNTGRTAEESNNKLQTVVNKGYPIYAIGINPQTDTYKSYITDIATKTGAKSYFPQNSDELRSIYAEILQTLSGSAGSDEDGLNGIIDISTEETVQKFDFKANIFEADIQIWYQGDLDVRLISPNGTEIVTGEDYKVIKESDYTVIKMFQPMEGEWQLALKGSENAKAEVSSIIYYSNLTAKLVGEYNDILEGDKTNFKAELFNGDIKIDNLNDFDNVNAVLTYFDNDSIERYDMTKQDDMFVVDAAIESTGSVYVEVDINGTKIISDTKKVIVSKNTVNDTDEQQEKDNKVTEKSKSSIIKILITILVVVIVVIIAFVIFRIRDNQKTEKAMKKLFGYLDVIDSAGNTNFINLTMYGNNVSLLNALGGGPPCLSNVIISGKLGGIKIAKLTDECSWYSNDAMETQYSNECSLSEGQSLEIEVKEENYSITIKYAMN